MSKICRRCGGREEDGVRFYPSQKHRCAACTNAANVAARTKPGRRERVNAANNAWLRANPASNREAVRRWRERNPAPGWVVPPDKITIGEAAEVLGLSRVRVDQLVDGEVLAAELIDGHLLIDRADLERLLRQRERGLGG